ncbi:hypothetical protein [Amycolatopsis sp. NBC_00355]|uniref:hypothetical protein n=1 Tax=Amycolatopsis sp. NBC_00355 TaxID=2975957 RepID=UPI003FA45E82
MPWSAGAAAKPGQSVSIGPEDQLFGDNLARVGICAGVFRVDVDSEESWFERADDRAGGTAGVEDADGVVEAVGDRVRVVVGVDDDEWRAEECLVEARR